MTTNQNKLIFPQNEFNSTNTFYDEFHSETKPLKKIPRDDDFSLKYHISAYNEFFKSGLRVLDVGCGGAAMSFYAASKGCIVTGIDASGKAIEAGKEAARRLELKNIVFKNISLFDIESEFDLIILNEVMEHMPNDSAALKKIHGLLSSEGKLLLSVPLEGAPLHKIYKYIFDYDPFDKKVGHLRRYKTTSLQCLLQEHNFEVMKIFENEGLLRNWLFNDKIGRVFMKLNRGAFIKKTISLVDEKIFCPLFGYSDVILIAKKNK